MEDAVQLLTNGLLVGFAPAIELKLPSRPTPNAAEKAPDPPASGCSFIPLHTRTRGHGLSRFRDDRQWSLDDQKGAQTLAPRKADAVAEARHTIDRILSRQEG